MENAPVTVIAIRIAAPGTPKQEFARRAEALADAELALPASKGALSKIVLYFPNETHRDVVEKLQLGLPPVCALARYEFASDEARLMLLANPEFNRLSGQFDPLGTNTTLPVEIATYIDQPSVLSSGVTMTGLMVMHVPTRSDNYTVLAHQAADLHQKLKPSIEEFLATPEAQRVVANHTVFQMSRVHQFPSRAIVESRGNSILTRNQC
uniref:EthD domain-containing protein n=1 Tax=Mycena chlorophos TaxID=658473 RepID=A0ABQ0L8W8_MYCCL|nr:predicted protein [Mycena chlorophos]